MAQVCVRALAAADKQAWLALWAGYLAFYKATLAPEVTETTFARLTGADDGHVRARRRAGRSASSASRIASCTARPGLSAPYVYLNDLFVAPEARGSGAGRALIEAVYANGRRDGRRARLLADA